MKNPNAIIDRVLAATQLSKPFAEKQSFPQKAIDKIEGEFNLLYN